MSRIAALERIANAADAVTSAPASGPEFWVRFGELANSVIAWRDLPEIGGQPPPAPPAPTLATAPPPRSVYL